MPEHYLLGFDDQKIEAEGVPRKFTDPKATGPEGDQIDGYPVYLDGQLSQRSWWYYYLMTLVYKVPEGTWLLVLASFAALLAAPWSRDAVVRRADGARGAGFVLFVMSVFTNINLGLRYVLPIFPYVYVSTGKLAPWAWAWPRPPVVPAAGADRREPGRDRGRDAPGSSAATSPTSTPSRVAPTAARST